MTRSSTTSSSGLVPFDPEIEKTCRAHRETKRKLLTASVSVSGSDILNSVDRMKQNSNQTLRDLASSDGSNQPLCIQYSEEVEFELRSGIINLLPKFHGLAGEDPNRHLQEFHMVCSTMKPHGVSEEVVKLRAFPFSLADLARDWLYYIPPGSVTCWNDMRRMFLDKFFPASRTNAIRKSISGIQQVNGETLYEYWERFKRLCASCPQHQISDQLLIQYFYEGLLNMDRSLIDAASGGALVNKTPVEARELIETMAENYQQFGTKHVVERGVHEAQVIHPDQGKTINKLEEMLARMELTTKQLVSYQHQHSTTESVQAMRTCSICSNTLHLSDTCPTLQPEEAPWCYEQSVAAANAFPNRSQYQQNQQGRYDPLSSTYNLGWRDHPNLRYGNPMAAQQPNSHPYQSFYQKAPGFYQNVVPTRVQQQGGFQQFHQQPQSYQQNFQQPSRPLLLANQPESANQDLKELLQQMVLGQQQTQAALQNLGQQLNQLASNSGKMNPGQLQISSSGQLPSQVIPNPRGNVSAITLRSGKSITGPKGKNLYKESEVVDPTRQLQFGTVPSDLLPSSKLPGSQVLARSKESTLNVSLPFPQRMVQPKKETSIEKAREFQELMDTFSKVEVNIPLLKVIKNIPKYAKFLKDLCVHKRKLKGDELVSMGKNVSALFQSMPQKCQDPGVFTIPCEIGESSFGDAMLDLGASINVMPKSVFQALGIGPLQSTRIVIQLANRSFAHPVGVLEDVLVKVRDLIFPADFYVLDMEGDTMSSQVPIILGRPFLKTARTKIDVHAGTLSMEFGDTKVQFNVLDAVKYPAENHSVLSVEVFDELEVDSDIILLNCLNSLEHQDFDKGDDVNFNLETEVDQETVIKVGNDPKSVPAMHSVLESVPELFSLLEESFTPVLPSAVKPPEVELKVLPDHSKYAYLREEEQLPVIIAKGLEPDQEDRLLEVLRSHQQAIGWTVADIIGIDSSICMHRILLEDGARPIRQPQRRLNPLILDVVKKEVVKLLKAGIIYPISDSVWVSPVQVVPKKSGLTVVANKENELISTRIQNSWRVCIDYRRLNHVTRKDHFPLPFVDQMLERLAGKTHYCFLDGYSGYFQIGIAPEDQDKTTFTCPFGTFAYRRMPFGLCNAPGTFQRCMVFTGDSSGTLVPLLCHCHICYKRMWSLFLMKNAKMLLITSGKSLLHLPLFVLLIGCCLLNLCVMLLILQLERFLQKRVDGASHVISYASRTLDSAQSNYATTEKELLAIVFALDKFRSYLLCSHVIIFSDHAALKFFLKKSDAKPRLIRWMFLLQEFDIEIRDRSGKENLVADHLSRIEGVKEKFKEELSFEEVIYPT